MLTDLFCHKIRPQNTISCNTIVNFSFSLLIFSPYSSILHFQYYSFWIFKVHFRSLFFFTPSHVTELSFFFFYSDNIYKLLREKYRQNILNEQSLCQENRDNLTRHLLRPDSLREEVHGGLFCSSYLLSPFLFLSLSYTCEI